MLRHHFEELSTPEQLDRFKQRYEAAIVAASKGKTTTSVPIEYLDRARVFGLHDASRQLVGGFAINLEAPFLVLNTLPPAARNAWLRESPESEQCELVAIWKAPHLRQAAAAFVLWPRIIRECTTAGRKHILGLGYQNRMNAVYGIARPTQLYSGLRADKPELRQHVTIYAYTPLSITLTYVTNLCTELVLKPPRRMLGRLRRRILH